MRWRCMLVLAALLLAGCGTSPQTHYFTLSAMPGAKEKAAISRPVTMAAVEMPPSLDRREMVRHTGANTVEISDEDRWAAPLGEMTRRVLSQDLATRLQEGKLVLPDAPAPADTARIAVALAEFGADGSGKIVLKGSWSVLEGDGNKPVLRRDVALETGATGTGGSAQAAGMSRLLGQLASAIAQGLTEPL